MQRLWERVRRWSRREIAKRFWCNAVAISVCGAPLAVSAPTIKITAERLSGTPLLSPVPGWSSAGRFNPAAVKRGDRTVLLFRAVNAQGTSRIGYAESTDGLRFTVRPEPVLQPEAPYEAGGGVEDPRVVLINGLYYLTYTGYNRHDAQLCLATSKDLVHWDRKGVILPAYRGTWNTQWTKSGAIYPEKINGKWWMYYLGTMRDPDGKQRDHMGVASSDDLLHWTDATEMPVLTRRPGAWDSRVMEPGPAPVMTPAGLLLFYNGANEGLVYGPGWILFDPHDPTRVLMRSSGPMLRPLLDWEQNGTVPNVIFLEGAVADGATGEFINRMSETTIHLKGYYGAADKFTGAVKITISTLAESGR